MKSKRTKNTYQPRNQNKKEPAHRWSSLNITSEIGSPKICAFRIVSYTRCATKVWPVLESRGNSSADLDLYSQGGLYESPWVGIFAFGAVIAETKRELSWGHVFRNTNVPWSLLVKAFWTPQINFWASTAACWIFNEKSFDFQKI